MHVLRLASEPLYMKKTSSTLSSLASSKARKSYVATGEKHIQSDIHECCCRGGFKVHLLVTISLTCSRYRSVPSGQVLRPYGAREDEREGEDDRQTQEEREKKSGRAPSGQVR